MPCFELPSAFTKQDELWKFSRHPLYEGEGLGQYGQKDSIPYVVRLWEKIDRDADRREAAEKVLTFEADLAPGETSQMMLDFQRSRRRRRPLGMLWMNAEDEAEYHRHNPAHAQYI